MNSVKASISSRFNLNGFRLRVEAARHLEGLLKPLERSEAEEWIERVVEGVAKRNLDSAVVDKDTLVSVVQECSNREVGDDEALAFNLVDAFSVPRFTYCEERKKYIADDELGRPAPMLYADAPSKSDLFRSRYAMLLQRTGRHDLFTPSSSAVEASFAFSKSSSSSEKKFKLKAVEFLLGTVNKLSDVIVLGMLTQVTHGKYSLEDPTGAVTLDLADTKFHTGLYTENCFVLVEGWYEDAVFHVTAMGFPPAELAANSRAYFGNVNFFGGPHEHSVRQNKKLIQLEKDNAESMFVFLSDVWLDRADVMERLNKLFAGYSAMPPSCFVFMGNFLSTPYGSRQAKVLEERFRALGEMIAEYPDIAESSRFVFVPGPTDPGSANIFPRPPIPDCVVGAEEFRRRVPNASFVSNPCRLQYCSQEIVLFREDIVTKMCRNCIYFPDSGDIPTHFVKTVVSQGHLAPLPLHTCPVYWDHDAALRIYPLPDLVVIGDKFDPFCAEEQACKVVNPGSFCKTDFSFKTYIPATRELEDSQVPGD